MQWVAVTLIKYVTFIKIWILGPLLLLLNRLCLLKLWKMGLCYVYSMHDVYSILKSTKVTWYDLFDFRGGIVEENTEWL